MVRSWRVKILCVICVAKSGGYRNSVVLTFVDGNRLGDRLKWNRDSHCGIGRPKPRPVRERSLHRRRLAKFLGPSGGETFRRNSSGMASLLQTKLSATYSPAVLCAKSKNVKPVAWRPVTKQSDVKQTEFCARDPPFVEMEISIERRCN